MKFNEAINSLSLNREEKKRIHDILSSWEKEYPYEIRNLFKEIFLSDPVMQHIVIKLCECPSSWSHYTLRQELEKHFYSWMQLKGGKCTSEDITDFGIVAPLNTLRNSFALTDSFFKPKRFDDFLDELMEQENPGQWTTSNGYGKLRIKPSQFICWFFWNPIQKIKDPLELLRGKTGNQICDILNLETKRGQLIAMSFDMELSRQDSNGWHLFRPTWVEGGSFQLFRTVTTQNLGYGIVNPSYSIIHEGEELNIEIAEGVSRAAYVQLKYLKKIQIF